MDWFRIPLRRAFDFSGRSDRVEFWVFEILTTVALLVVEAIELSLWGVPVLFVLICLFLLIPSLSLMVRRLHDTGRSGWWVLLCFGVITGIIPLVYCLGASQPGANQYGPGTKSNARNPTQPLGQPINQRGTMPTEPPTVVEQGLPASVCGSCGTEQKPGSKFCANCGSSLKA